MDTMYILTREDLIEFLTNSYEGWNLDLSDRQPDVPFNEQTIRELFQECMDLDYLSGSVTEDGPTEVFVDGIHVLKDCWITTED
jgi:hypothetical protein